MRIGGIAGIGTTDASADISLQKSSYHVGEGIKVTIDMNNSTCAKPVKSYKFKLKRTIKCLGRKQIALLTSEEYLITVKEPGCEAKVKDTKEYVLEIPSIDQNFGKTEFLHPELRQLVKMFSDTTESSLFAIEYQVDVFIKHKSKVEFGMGNMVSFPVKIYQNQTNIAHIAQKS